MQIVYEDIKYFMVFGLPTYKICEIIKPLLYFCDFIVNLKIYLLGLLLFDGIIKDGSWKME